MESFSSNTAILCKLGGYVLNTAGTTLNGTAILLGVSVISSYCLSTMKNLTTYITEPKKDDSPNTNSALVTITKAEFKNEMSRLGLIGGTLLFGLGLKWSGSKIISSSFIKVLESVTSA